MRNQQQFGLQNRRSVPKRTASRRRWNWRLIALALLAAVIVIALGAVVFHTALEEAAARFLIASDPPEKSDLIYILGGNYDVRAPAAAALYRQGWAPKILLAREPSGVSPDGSRAKNFTDVTRRILTENGVPSSHITEFLPANGVRTTADEARALRLYLDSYPASRILLVTSAFHSRRARMAVTRAVPMGTRVIVVAARDSDCDLTNWQHSEYCRKHVELECIKFAYYFVTFWG